MVKVFIVFIYIALSPNALAQTSFKIDTPFDAQRDAYHLATGRTPWYIRISFVEHFNERDVIGYCYLSEGRIQISKEFWMRASSAQKEALIFHELGHCDMGQYHRDTLIYLDQCPKSIMNPEVLSTECYMKHRDELIEELNDHIDPHFK